MVTMKSCQGLVLIGALQYRSHRFAAANIEDVAVRRGRREPEDQTGNVDISPRADCIPQGGQERSERWDVLESAEVRTIAFDKSVISLLESHRVHESRGAIKILHDAEAARRIARECRDNGKRPDVPVLDHLNSFQIRHIFARPRRPMDRTQVSGTCNRGSSPLGDTK